MGFNVIGTLGRVTLKNLSEGKIWAYKHIPELLQIAGGIEFVGTCVSVAKGTIKAHDVTMEYRANKKEIEDAAALNDPNYGKNEIRRDRIIAAGIAGKGYAKCYLPSVVRGTFSLSCLCGASYILKSRNVALAAAYATLNDGFKSYRGRVIDKYGEEEDYRLKTGITTEKEVVTEIGEDGKKHKMKVDVDYIEGEPSGYTFMFDDAHSMMNVTDSIVARDQLMMAENSANVILQARGYILLNEVLRSIGLHETTAGAIVGWQTKGNGDGFVDFRMKQVRTKMDEGGVAFILDFNVDGPIYQDIDKYTRAWEE